jgi:hypothetical protein
MPKAILLVLSEASDPSRQAEYDDWYDNTHLAEVCAIPGITGARRFVPSEHQMTPGASLGGPRHLAIYEIDADDLTQIGKELGERGSDGRMNMSNAIKLDPPPTVVLFELHEPVSGTSG